MTYHILEGENAWGEFSSPGEAEGWLSRNGWVKEGGAGNRWRFIRPGKATLFSTVGKTEVMKLQDLLSKMQE